MVNSSHPAACIVCDSEEQRKKIGMTQATKVVGHAETGRSFSSYGTVVGKTDSIFNLLPIKNKLLNKK